MAVLVLRSSRRGYGTLASRLALQLLIHALVNPFDGVGIESLLADVVVGVVGVCCQGVQNVLANGALALIVQDLDVRCTLIVIRILLVLVEADHLADDGLGHLVQGRQCKRCNRNIHIAQLPNDWLQLQIIDTVQWLDHLQVILLLLIF